MRLVEFHEQEFEGFLYSQLEQTDKRLWHPHEVLEHYLGFDRALFLTNYYLWNLKGYRQPFQGISPFYRYDLWPDLAKAGISRQRLPRFRLNCFLQAKRPEYAARTPRIAASLGQRRPIYRISLDKEQQQILERVADRVADRAIVAYAAPVFHRSQDLFRHGTAGTIVESATFPDVAALKGHTFWYYNEPGARGIRNPDPEPVSFRSLGERLDALIASVRTVETASHELSSLADAIRSAILEQSTELGAREAYLAQEWRSVDAFCEATDAPAAARSYLATVTFCRYFLLDWLIISDSYQQSTENDTIAR
jgi:hypothetical protein